MKKLNIFGPVEDPTGYSEMTREIIRELYLRGIHLSLQKFDKWSGIKTQTLLDPVLNLLSQTPYHSESPLLNFCLPEQVRLDPYNLNINFSMFEADGIPQNWVNSCKQIDHIIVPSKFCKSAWVNSGVPEHKISIVGLGVDPSRYHPNVPNLQLYTEEGTPLQEKYKYRVMNIQEIVERKNLDGILRCWLKSKASKRDDSCLILKLSSYSGDRLDYFKARVDELKRQYGSPNCNNIYSYTHIVTEDLVAPLIRNATHYISMSFGEGWDLNVMKAGAMAKIVCAPNSTSYTEYLREDNCYLIPIKRKELCKQTGPTARLYKDLNWFIPDEDYVINFFDTLGENGEESIKKIQNFYTEITQKLTWTHTASNLINVLDNVQLTQKSKPKIVSEKRNGVLLFCKSLNPGASRCGIANYTTNLHNSICLKHPSILVGGMDNRLVSVVDEHPVAVMHLQNEYQFHSKNRLRYFLSENNKRNVATVVTQHTVSRQAIEYNDVVQEYADKVLVHSERAKQEWDKMYGEKDSKCVVIPMGCMPTVTDEELKDVKIENELIKNEGKFTIGYFGFTYYHKGIDRLLFGFKNLNVLAKDTYLMLLANKPVQDAAKFSEKCNEIIKTLDMKFSDEYYWNKDYLEEAQVIKYLKKCDLIVLPYDEYGGVGTSAAIRTCLRAGVPVVVSDTCWFSDVDCVEKFDLEKLQHMLIHEYSNKDNQMHKFKRINAQKKYVIENSYENIAKKHVDLYKSLTNK